MNGAGDSSGSSNNGSMSTVSKAEVVEPELHDYVGLSEVSSYPKQIRVEGEELELGLGLGFGPKVRTTGCRILTAKDFPSMVSSSPSPSHRAGTKRAAESVAQEAGSTSPGQVVGWPPIRAYRMNSMVNQTRASPEDSPIEKQINTSKNVFKSSNTFNSNNIGGRGHGKSLFVKVNMDGTPIGRKLDLNAHTCYQTLAQALDDMFQRPSNKCPGGAKEHEVKEGKAAKLLDGSSEFVLTYEDKDGDWMLVGDVPWGMFLSTVKRLRIMRTSEVNGLSPRFQDKGDRQRSKPI